MQFSEQAWGGEEELTSTSPSYLVGLMLLFRRCVLFFSQTDAFTTGARSTGTIRSRISVTGFQNLPAIAKETDAPDWS